MYFIVAYDVSNDNRRVKIAKLLSDYGMRTQYSVFECYLKAEDLSQLREKAAALLKDKTDAVYCFPLCEACRRKIVRIGKKVAGSVEPPPYYWF